MKSKRRPRVVIDTNILISAALVPQSPPDKLIRLWEKDIFTLLTSREQLEEIRDVAQRKEFQKYSIFSDRATEIIAYLERGAQMIVPIPVEDLPLRCRDPKDDFLLACSLSGNAEYLVTGDKDLLELDKTLLGKLKIARTTDFLKRVR